MRLIDLHCNWASQYACESTQYDPALYADVRGRLSQVDGYLSGVADAVLYCGRRPEDWSVQADPWRTLGEMIARYEAEFSGRILHGPNDAARWLAEPQDETICWGVLAVEGLLRLVAEPADLIPNRLFWLFNRGVRVFQLGGGAVAAADGARADLIRQVLDGLEALAPDPGQASPRPVVDLAGLDAESAALVLSWFEENPTRCDRLLLVRSLEGVGPAGLSEANLSRLRALGGVVGLGIGPPFLLAPEELRESIERIAAVPFRGRTGYEGIGIGTMFLELERTVPSLADAAEICAWLKANYPSQTALSLAEGNARTFLLRASGAGVPC